MSPTESIPKYVVSELSSASVIIGVDGVLCVTGVALLLFLSLLLLLLLLLLFLLFATLFVFDSCCALPTRGKVASLGALPLLHPVLLIMPFCGLCSVPRSPGGPDFPKGQVGAAVD